MSNIESLIAGMSYKWVLGFKVGLTVFAHWKSGVQYVGTCGTTLQSVLTEIDEYIESHPQDTV